MKIITLFGGKEAMITDEEAKKIYQALNAGKEGLILLKNGDAINPKGIASIVEVPVKQYLNGREVIFGQYVQGVGGERYYLVPEDWQDMKWCYDPKYFGGEKIEAGLLDAPKEISKFALEGAKKIKSMVPSAFSQNPNKVLSKENNWGR